MKRGTFSLMIGLLLILALCPMAAAQEKVPVVEFMNSGTFDMDMVSLLEKDVPVVVVVPLGNSGWKDGAKITGELGNAKSDKPIPKKLDKWLCTAKKYGGKVKFRQADKGPVLDITLKIIDILIATYQTVVNGKHG